MKIKQLLLPAFTVAVGMSFVAAEVKAAKENVDFTGRARGWYVSSSDKADSKKSTKATKATKTISNTQFKADGRMGFQLSETEGDWTGSAKAELESHNDGSDGAYTTGYRDVWAQVENKMFAVRVGRQWHGDFCVTAYYPLGVGGDDCIGGLLDRTQGVKFSSKGLPVSLNFNYVDVDAEGNSDTTGYGGNVTWSMKSLTVNGIYESKDTAGNKDKGGNKDKTASDARFGILGTYVLGKLTFSGGYESTKTSSNQGTPKTAAVDAVDAVTVTSIAGNPVEIKPAVAAMAAKAKSKDIDDDQTFIVAAVAFDLGNGMGVGAFLDRTQTNTNTKMLDKNEKLKSMDDTIKTQYTLSFEKAFPVATATVGYHSSSQTAHKGRTGTYADGKTSAGIAVGLKASF